VQLRILVAGQSKTGTSALWSAIKQSLPPGYFNEFENPNYRGSDRRILLKLIVGTCDFSGTMDFDKRILIVRDPRDSLVSRLMYAVYDMGRVYQNPQRTAKWLATVERKADDPRSISVRRMMGTLESLAGDLEYLLRALVVYRMVENWQAQDWHVAHYEPFVAGDYAALEDYLGFPLDGWTGKVWHSVKRVERRKEPGAWRHWFTPDDVAHFRPLFRGYMARWGYEDDWALADEPHIERQHTVDYVKRILRERGARF